MVDGEDPKPSTEGTLPSTYVGVWRPLELYEAPAPASVEPAPVAFANPPVLRARVPLGSPNPEISRLATQICLGQRQPSEIHELLRRAGDDVPTLRLLSTLSEEYRPELVRRLEALGVHALAPSLHRFERPAVIPGLTDGDEHPDWRDGLTETQRRVVILMRELAPNSRPPVPTAELVDAICRRDAKATAARVERALVDLSHPRLRAFPLVEATGASAGLPLRVEAARLADWAEAFFRGELELPLLLLNGAAGRGTAFPSFSHEDLYGPANEVMLPDFPTGGVLDGRGLGELRRAEATTIRLRARVWIEQQSDRFRLVIDQLPWPLTSEEVARRVRALASEGAIEGVLLVHDDGSRVEVEFVHLAWARRAARGLTLFGTGLLDGPVQVTYTAMPVVAGPAGPVVLSPAGCLQAYLTHHREFSSLPVAGARDPERIELSKAEAIAVALTIIDAIQAALRSTVDVAEERQALMTVMTPTLRERLAPLGRLSHPYERGFTSDQASYLLSVKKLGSRSREFAVAEFTRLRDEVAHLDLSRVVAVDASTRRWRENALIRFPMYRRLTQVSLLSR